MKEEQENVNKIDKEEKHDIKDTVKLTVNIGRRLHTELRIRAKSEKITLSEYVQNFFSSRFKNS